MRSRPPHPVAAGTESDAPSDPRDPGSGNEHTEALLARHLPVPRSSRASPPCPPTVGRRDRRPPGPSALSQAAPVGEPRAPAAPWQSRTPGRRLHAKRRPGKTRVAVVAVAIAVLAGAVVTKRSALAASVALLGHLQWGWIPSALTLELASLAALAGMQRRLLVAGRASVGVRPMLATTFAANAVSVSVPLAGPELGTLFTFRRLTRQGADATLASWSLLAGAWSRRRPVPWSWPGAGCRLGIPWCWRQPRPSACSQRRRLPRWPWPHRGRGCAAYWSGPPAGRCATGGGYCAGEPRIPGRPPGPGLAGWGHCTFRRRAG